MKHSISLFLYHHCSPIDQQIKPKYFTVSKLQNYLGECFIRGGTVYLAE